MFFSRFSTPLLYCLSICNIISFCILLLSIFLPISPVSSPVYLLVCSIFFIASVGFVISLYLPFPILSPILFFPGPSRSHSPRFPATTSTLTMDSTHLPPMKLSPSAFPPASPLPHPFSHHHHHPHHHLPFSSSTPAPMMSTAVFSSVGSRPLPLVTASSSSTSIPAANLPLPVPTDDDEDSEMAGPSRPSAPAVSAPLAPLGLHLSPLPFGPFPAGE